MGKQSKEEEAKIIAEMEEAMKENEKVKEEQTEKRVGPFRDKTPENIHCRKCGTMMENGKCPRCGYTMYVPMDGNKQKNIRLIIGGVCLLVFLVIYLTTR